MATTPDEVDPWNRLIAGLRAGERDAALDFWNRFGPLLHKVADKHLARGMRRRVGPEDVVQSACRTFLRRAQGGEFQLPDSDSLWNLLCAITLTKIREQTRFHMRQRRGLDQEAHALPADQSGAGFGLVAAGPTPADAVAFADLFEKLLADMDDEERQIVDLKLQDLTQEEVAQRLGCSERTVRRILKRVEQRLNDAFDLPTPT